MRKFLTQFIAGLFILVVFFYAAPAYADIRQDKITQILNSRTSEGIEDLVEALSPQEKSFLGAELKKRAITEGLNVVQLSVAEDELGIDVPDTSTLPKTSRDKVLKALSLRTGNAAPSQEAQDAFNALTTKEERDLFQELRALTLEQGLQASDAATVAARAQADEAAGACSITGTGGITGCLRDSIIWLLTTLVVPALGLILSFAGSILDLSVRISVIDFAEYANLPVFREIWALGRDLVNIFFIFILLYSAFDTLLGVGKQKFQDTLGTIVLVAILINFSYPIARVMIDVSNVFANEFYQAINPDGTKLSQVIIKNLSFLGQTNLNNVADFSRLSTNSENAAKTVPANPDFTSTIVSFFGVIIVMITLLVNLLLAAYFFLQRTVTLLILITFSAMAFAAQLVPKMKDVYKYYGEWWSKLINELTYAPAYLLLLYFALRVSGAAGQIIEKANSSSAGSAVSVQGIGAAIYFVILVGLLNAAISLAKDSGAAGASTAKQWADSTQSWLLNKPKQLGYATAGLAGRTGLALGKAVTVTPANYIARQTLAPLAGKIAERPIIKTLAANTSFGKSLQESLEKTKKEGFGQKALTDESKAFLERFKDADAVEKARAIGATNLVTGMDETTAKQVFKGLSDQDKAAIKYEAETSSDLDEATKKRIEMLYTESTKKPEDKAKLDRAKTEVEVKAKVKKLIEKLGKEKKEDRELKDDDKTIIKKIPKNLLLAYAETLIDDKNRNDIFQHLTAAQISQLISEAELGDKRDTIKDLLTGNAKDSENKTIKPTPEMEVALGNARVRENLGLPPAAKGASKKKKGSPQPNNTGPGPRPQSDEERDYGSQKAWEQSLG